MKGNAGPPFHVGFVDDAAVGFHALVKRRAAQRNHDIEIGRRNLVVLQELQGCGENLPVVGVRAEHEIEGIADVPLVEVVDHLLVTLRAVELLAHGFQGALGDALDPHIDVQQAGSLGQVEEFRVETEARRKQGGPAHLERNQGFQQRHRARLVAHELAGGEEDVAAAAALDFLDHLLDRAVAVSVIAVQAALGAEIASVGTAAGLLDNERPVEHVMPGIEQIPARGRHAREAGGLVAPVELLQPPGGGVFQHFGEDVFRLPDADAVGMVGHLVAVEGRVGPAHQNRDLLIPELVGDLVGPQRGHRPGGDGDDVDRSVVIHLFDRVVGERHVPAARRQGR